MFNRYDATFNCPEVKSMLKCNGLMKPDTLIG